MLSGASSTVPGPAHRASVHPSWLFLASSWTYIYILCIYMPATLVKVG